MNDLTTVFETSTVTFYQTRETTLCRLTLWDPVNGRDHTFIGTAKLFSGDDETPGDKFNAEHGQVLAMARAMEKATNHYARQARGLSKCQDDNFAHSQTRKKTVGELTPDEAYAVMERFVSTQNPDADKAVV